MKQATCIATFAVLAFAVFLTLAAASPALDDDAAEGTIKHKETSPGSTYNLPIPSIAFQNLKASIARSVQEPT